MHASCWLPTHVLSMCILLSLWLHQTRTFEDRPTNWATAPRQLNQNEDLPFHNLVRNELNFTSLVKVRTNQICPRVIFVNGGLKVTQLFCVDAYRVRIKSSKTRPMVLIGKKIITCISTALLWPHCSKRIPLAVLWPLGTKGTPFAVWPSCLMP